MTISTQFQCNFNKTSTAEYERRKAEREKEREDAVQMRIRQAQSDKERRLKEFADMAKQGKKDISLTEDHIRKKHAEADALKAKKLEDMKEMAKVNAEAYNIGWLDVFYVGLVYYMTFSCLVIQVCIVMTSIPVLGSFSVCSRLCKDRTGVCINRMISRSQQCCIV